jgi:thiol-disulfide isomerase/thioredoxin
MAQVTELTSLEAYNTELEKPGVVVIDFYSTQCPPCKASHVEVGGDKPDPYVDGGY